MTGINIRKLKSEDFSVYDETIRELFLESFQHSFPAAVFSNEFIADKVKQCADFLNAGEAVVFGLFDAGEMLGLAYVYPKDCFGIMRLHLNHIAVLPEFSGKGLGKQLMAAVMDLAAELQIAEISLDVSADNKTAVSLYQKLGFVTDRLSCIKRL